ncbi:MAG: hypothetical protein HUJ66_07635 [Oscillospiraceae bacterium]|nr:hypothetical protein [Oscillospiraceae bacterium]
MKRKLSAVILVLTLLLGGCELIGGRAESVTGGSFQYNEGSKDYSLFFGLCDRDGKPVSASAEVDIRIVNDCGETVYTDTREITEADFDAYTNAETGDSYLAELRIRSREIEKGSAAGGTVYFTVRGKNFTFEECSTEAFMCLPVRAAELVTEELPLELCRKYYGTVEAKLLVTEVSCELSDSMYSPWMRITVSGEKTYGADSGYDIMCYELCDSSGVTVDSGRIYAGENLRVGDSFSDDSLVIYDISPGETYTLKLSDYEW